MADIVPIGNDFDQDVEPWEKQTGERSEAFHAFTHFRDLPPWKRSVRLAYQDHMEKCRGIDKDIKGSVSGSWGKWSKQHNWITRSESNDGDVDKRQRNRNIFEYNKSRRDVAEIAMELLGKLKMDVEQYEAGFISPDRLPSAIKITGEVILTMLGGDLQSEATDVEEVILRRYSSQQFDALHGKLPGQKKATPTQVDDEVIDTHWEELQSDEN